MESGLKWVHMARYEPILRLDGALWLPIISGPLPTPRWSMKIEKIPKECPHEPRMIYHLTSLLASKNAVRFGNGQKIMNIYLRWFHVASCWATSDWRES